MQFSFKKIHCSSNEDINLGDLCLSIRGQQRLCVANKWILWWPTFGYERNILTWVFVDVYCSHHTCGYVWHV